MNKEYVDESELLPETPAEQAVEYVDESELLPETPVENSNAIPTWEESTPLIEDAPWERYQNTAAAVQSRPLMWNSRDNRMRIMESFAAEGDVLSFIEDPEVRGYVQYMTGKMENPELERKRWALSAYYAQLLEQDIVQVHRDLHQIIKEQTGKIVPIEKEFYRIARTFHPDKNFFFIEYEYEIHLFCICLISCVFLFLLYLLRKIISNFFYNVFRRIESFFCNISINIKSLTDIQKIFFGFAVVSIFLLVLSLLERFDNGFYVFLRFTTCIALVGLCLNKIGVWIKFPLILLAILYNPVIQIHLGDRDVWLVFNVITIPALLIPWIVIVCKTGKKENNGTSQER